MSHESAQKRLRIGTCSWKFPSWEGLVYSRAKGINYLEEYARKYDTVEVDQWFWSLFGPDSVGLPRSTDVEGYRSSVPGDFRFTVKAPNSLTLTHFYKYDKKHGGEPNPYFFSPELMRDFLATLEPLRHQIQAVMFQFEYLNKQKMPGLHEFLARFDDFLRAIPKGWPYAVEVRNPNYLKPPYFEFLRERGISAVLVQGYFLPPLVESYRVAGGSEGLNSPVIMRLMGPDRKAIEEKTKKQWNTLADDRSSELEGIAGTIEELRRGGHEVIVNVNNHYEGSAPISLDRLAKLLGHLNVEVAPAPGT
jgi:uncharacterized protein YecE (DUF72 family)